MEIFVALIVFGAVFAAVTAANRSVQRRNSAWADAAGRLGLDFQPGTTFKRRAIRGSRGAIHIDLNEKSGGNNNTVREWRLAYPSTPFSMTLTVETPGKKLLKAFGAQDFEIGDSTFDSKFMVAGSDQASIAYYLNPERRAALLDAAEKLPGVKVTNSDVTWRTSKQYKDSADILSDAKTLLRTAAAMTADMELPERGTVAPPPPPPSPLAGSTRDPWTASHDLPARKSTPGIPPSPPPVLEAEEEVAVEPSLEEPSSESALPGSGGLVRLEDLIEEIFGTRRLSFEANRLVAEKYQGRPLMVLGPVRVARKESRDFDFRDQGPGVRIEAVVGEVTGTRVGAGEVIAIAYLEGAVVPPKRGSEVLITGTILKVEALRRAIYLVDAQLG